MKLSQNKQFSVAHRKLAQYLEKATGMTVGMTKSTTEIICILTVSFYASLIMLLISVIFKIGAADDVVTWQVFYPELPRQIIITLLAGLPPAILSFRWLRLHP